MGETDHRFLRVPEVGPTLRENTVRCHSLRARREASAPLRVQVLSFGISKGHYVEYTMLCQSGGEAWKVKRRFSEFQTLHAEIQRVATVQLPGPPSRLCGDLRWRQAQLESYLRKLLELRGSLGLGERELCKFLNYPQQQSLLAVSFLPAVQEAC